ncbi:MAG: eukaryotic-like serine/threonine-protein kinase [Acidobacteriota bacterium]|nr:eukaryotic-like serine/threonine-protein kinase [Acidobacteriota bacterium]
MPLEAGDVLGRYKIISPLGRGGMGEVYLAEDTRLQRTVALKVLPEALSQNEQRLDRFDREARAASILNHPNVAHIYEIEISAERSFIAMEYINGETLRKRLATTRMKLHDAIDIAVQATRAIVAAHAAGIIHRDIKTENIMISRDGYVKVLDFGLAKLVESSPDNPDPAAPTVTSAHTDPGVVMGTFSYMSPEQARGLSADARTDLWSLGVVLYEMVGGVAPFVGATPSDVLSSILNDEPPPLARFARDVPEALEWIVMKALTKQLEGRYQTAAELLTDLQRLKNRLGAEAEIERFSIPDYRISRNSSTNSRSGFSLSRASAWNAGATNSVHAPSSAEYIVSGIKRHKKPAIIALLSVVILSSVGAYLYLRRGNPAPLAPRRQPTMSRVTAGKGLQLGATWAPDANFIAYSSDASGNFEIWVQPLKGGNPVQVTHSEAHDWQPDWSRNGDGIVFRSERDGGGLYIVPSLGGLERKVASFGYRPRWSPDGTRILFVGPGQRLFDYPKVYVVGLSGDAPSEISTSVGSAEEGVRGTAVGWHPDGKRVSFVSTDGTFWTLPLSGGKAVQSELAPDVKARLDEANVEFGDFQWSPSGRVLYFEGTLRGVQDIWRVIVEPETLRWIDGPDRLTTGTALETNIALSADGQRLAYTDASQSERIWLLPFDSTTGQQKGQGRPVTEEGLRASFADLSRDGKKLVFASETVTADRRTLLQRRLNEVRDEVLISDDYFRYFPRWSPDSTKLAYSRFRTLDTNQSDAGAPRGASKSGPIALFDTTTLTETLLTSQGPFLDYMYDWSPDGQSVLASSNRRTPERWEICLFPISAAPHAETDMRVVATDPENSLWTPRFSPDGRWILYIKQKPRGASVSVLYVVAATGGTPIRITGEDIWCDWPRWSIDGKTILFVSNHNSSFLNVWGIHFDPEIGSAVDKPFQVTSFESPGRMISPRLDWREMSLNKTQLALPITELSGNISMLENLER